MTVNQTTPESDAPVADPATDQAPVYFESSNLVRVSDSLKVGDHIINIAAEGVPQAAAASVLAEFVATLAATVALANLGPVPLADLPSVPNLAPRTPAQPETGPIAMPTLAEAVSPEILEQLRQRGVPAPAVPVAQAGPADVKFIPATDILHMRTAYTESGIPRVKFFTKRFHQHGIVCWETQENESVVNPLAAAGIEVGTMRPGQDYKVPAKIKGIQVRFKTPEGGGRPTPDRVLEVVV